MKHVVMNAVWTALKKWGCKMTRRQHWAKLAKEWKKNGRPFHYQYLIRKGGEE